MQSIKEARAPAPIAPGAVRPARVHSQDVGPIIWLGLAVVLLAAAVLSFAALRDLAVAVRIPTVLAPLLPVAVDAGAAVSCATWLSRGVDGESARFARGLTFALLGLTVAGNAAQLGMHANGIVPPWWVAVLVGAVPPAVAGGTVHLAVLVSRGHGSASTDGGIDARRRETILESRARELVAAGAGRPRLARELHISDHHARRLLRDIRRVEQPGEELA